MAHPWPMVALVVDDDAPTRRLLRIALGSYGFAIVEAANGQEALDALSESEPDVIVLDLEMPVMDGRTFMGRLDRDDMTAPIFILSAGEPRRAARELGADGWMAKPFDPESLVEAVASVASAGHR